MNPIESQTDLVVVADAGLGAGAGAYSVKLPAFEGPLDLLLHLIRQNEVEVTDIPVAQIADQYLGYVEMMRELELDVAAEYLVMAATLALIKSRMLLPPDGDGEAAEGLDPRAELVARLLEYQRYKEAAELLGRRRLLGRDVFDASGAEPERVSDAEREIEIGLFELLDAFRQVLERADDDGSVHQVDLTTESYTVRDRVIAIMELLETVESVEFGQIFEAAGAGRPSRALVVASFLAILELARLQALRIYQGVGEAGSPTGPIRLRAVSESAASSSSPNWRERISDLM